MIGPSPGMAVHQERWMVEASRWRQETVTTPGGGHTVDWVEDGTVLVVLRVPSPSERETAAQEGIEVTHTGDVPLSANVARGDRLVVDGLTVQVVSVVAGTHSSVQHIRARQEPWRQPSE